MRIDYVLYVLALVCFIAAGSITLYQIAETQLWVVAIAILGFIFLGIGYLQKPVGTITTEPSPEIATSTASTAELVTVAEETVSELTQVKGIGAKRAEQLQKLGIKTISDLANASARDLADKLDVSPKITRRWITNAKELSEKS
jgi:replicative superfamily II helicase